MDRPRRLQCCRGCCRPFMTDEKSKSMSEEYLTIDELSARLKLEPKTIRNKMASGVFRKGVHYFSPQGLRPRFKWSAIVAWLEGSEGQPSNGIPMKRGYKLNLATSEIWNNSEQI
jgi:hypothetical protein